MFFHLLIVVSSCADSGPSKEKNPLKCREIIINVCAEYGE